MLQRSLLCLLFIVTVTSYTGCASVTKGVVQALLDNADGDTDSRQCSIRGSAFAGIEPYLTRQVNVVGGDNGSARQRPVLKVLMVHGIGEHLPGYSTRLKENLAQALGLDVVEDQAKELALRVPAYPDEPLGTLRIHRLTDRGNRRELLFYELAWSAITATEKATLAYDDSGEYAFRRAELNNRMKTFFNSHIPDPLIYLGTAQDKIQLAVTQSMCWMMSRDWAELPGRVGPRSVGLRQVSQFCDTRQPEFLTELDDDYVFITHSLGSRIVTDAMQLLVRVVAVELAERPTRNLRLAVEVLQNKKIPIFMLANQLPLLQLGRERPAIIDQHRDYCALDGGRREQRIFNELTLVAFSDPNDILSYAVPPGFVDTTLDSRLCANLINVIVSVADEIDLFGFGRFVNPVDAHNGYENDPRVIALITHGIGRDRAAPVVAEQCTWLETRARY